MMAGIIRIVICAVIFFLLYNLIQKSEKIVSKKKWSIGVLILCAIIASATSFVPLENVFVTFQAPEEAYKYWYRGNIILVVDGEETTQVVAKSGDAFTSAILPKTETGWKIATAFEGEKTENYRYKNIHIWVSRNKNSDEYYLQIFDLNENELEISDDIGTVFHEYTEKYPAGRIEPQKFYFAYVGDLKNGYEITINGETFSITEDAEKIF